MTRLKENQSNMIKESTNEKKDRVEKTKMVEKGKIWIKMSDKNQK